jgi:hypothetical protein
MLVALLVAILVVAWAAWVVPAWRRPGVAVMAVLVAAYVLASM